MEDEIEIQTVPSKDITLSWNEDAQSVTMKFDVRYYRNWDFLIFCLQQAKDQAEMQKKVQQAMQAQAAMQEQAQAAALSQSLQMGPQYPPRKNHR